MGARDFGQDLGVLVDRLNSCLVVIDVQDCFLRKVPPEDRSALVARIAWLVRVARVLEIPVIATAEDIATQGGLVPELGELRALDKQVFGLYDQPDLRAVIDATGRRDFVLTGLETDVCIAHSAIGLITGGYRVAIPADAVGAPAHDHMYGIQRMSAAGAIISTVKGIYYEWVRDVPTTLRVKQAAGPAPIDL